MDDSCDYYPDFEEEEHKKKSLIWRTITSICIEPIAFVYAIGVVFRILANQQIILDKICYNDMEYPEEWCEKLGSKVGHVKNAILAEATVFLTKKELVGILPSIVMGMLVGVWCDMFRNGRRICLLLALTGNCCESFLCLLNAIYFDADKNWMLPTVLPTNLMGNGVLITLVSYLAANTGEKDRAFRFIVLDVFSYGGCAIGYLLGGLCMASDNKLVARTMHNYAGNYFISSILFLVCIVYAYFVVKESPKEVKPPINDGDLEMSVDSIDSGVHASKVNSSQSIVAKKKKKIFSFAHMKEAWLTLTKRRPDNFHRTIWILLFYAQVATLPLLGADNISYPLVQRLYNMDYVTYSQLATVNMIIRPFAILVILPFIIKKLQLRDLQISMVGCMSKILSWSFLAALLHIVGYYICILFNLFGSVTSLGVKSFLSKKLPKDEVSKIFSIIMTLEALQPFLGTFFYSTIFRATIDYYPTMAQQITVLMLTVVLAILCWVDNQFYTKELIEEERDRKLEAEGQASVSRRMSSKASIFTTIDLRRLSTTSFGASNMTYSVER